MKLVTPITPFKEETVDRGRFAGNVNQARLVLAIDAWNWVVAAQRGGENGDLFSDRFVGDLRLGIPLISRVAAENGLDQKETILSVIQGIAKVAKIDASGFEVTDLSDTALRELGTRVDEALGVTFFTPFPPVVGKRLFGEEEESPAEELAATA